MENLIAKRLSEPRLGIIDAKLLFATNFDLASSISSVSTDTALTNVVDMGSGYDHLGNALAVPEVGGRAHLDWVMICDGEDFDAVGSPVMTVKLVASAAAALSSPVTLLQFTTDKTPDQGELLIRGRVPPVVGYSKDLRYYGVLVNTTAAYSAGMITSWLDMGGPARLGP